MQARMRQVSLFAAAAGALVVVVGTTALAQSSNSEIGIWKLSVAQSKGTAIKSGTITIEAAGAGIKTIVDVDGTVNDHFAFTANYDGKDNPVVCENSARGLRGLTIIEFEHATEPLTALDRA
jgi:hypothetical protein